jgi:hypothetical protein
VLGLSVIVNPANEEALAHKGLLSHGKKYLLFMAAFSGHYCFMFALSLRR